jgi:porin
VLLARSNRACPSETAGSMKHVRSAMWSRVFGTQRSERLRLVWNAARPSRIWHRIDSASRSLADPSTIGIARRFRSNDGIYGIIDQTVYREPGKDDEGASAFVRAVGSPGDRNLVDLYLDAGIGYRGQLPARNNDTAGMAVSYARISPSARGADWDTILETGIAMTRRRFEALVEATYQAVLGPGVTVQPNLQYVFHPGGNIPDPRDPTGQHNKNATVVGVRATLTY